MRVMLMLVAGLLVAGPSSAEDIAAKLAQGKLEADLGHLDVAARAFEAVALAPEAPASLRFEARVRLGVVRRAQGDAKASADVFEAAWRERPEDPEAIGLLVRAVGAALPGQARWNEVWAGVSLQVDRKDPNHPEARVVWPGVESSLCPCSGAPIDLDLEEGDLVGIFRGIAEVSGLNIVVQPGVHGKVSYSAHQAPWDEVLDRVLAPNGFAAQRNGNLVTIGRAGDLPEKRGFSGKPISFDYVDVDLRRALGEIAAHGGARVEVPEGVSGRVTVILKDLPWDQAFDVMAWANNLSWTRAGDAIRVKVRRRGDLQKTRQ
jgi:hypothetical protein